jgi:ADP-heptose:LPS heptosyltransferase
MSTTLNHIIISRTDSIGDVMLTLPMCGKIKQLLPSCRITFLGRGYTQGIIEACEHVDAYLNWDELKTQSPAEQIAALQEDAPDAIIHVFPRKEILWLAKKAGIPLRISTGHRLHALTKCNKLVFFSRKNSDFHEAQLNFKLLRPLGFDDAVSAEEIAGLYGFNQSTQSLPPSIEANLQAHADKIKVILHPLSKGSAPSWSLGHYRELIASLPEERYHVYITGTSEEGQQLQGLLNMHDAKLTDLTGKLSLAQLIVFIRKCDALVAASTGPLHIAAACGIQAIGLFSPKRPMHPGRWAPIGKKAAVICADSHPKKGDFLAISSAQVLEAITSARS